MMMLRAILLTVGKELRITMRDRVGLFMLILAPIAVIAAAGFSLANIYAGGSSPAISYGVAFVDEDHGAVARAALDALSTQRELRVLKEDDRARALSLVRDTREAVVAVVVPSGTTAALEQGGQPRIILYTDPVRYLETVKIELGVAEICRQITAHANAEAQRRITDRQAELKRQIDSAEATLAQLQTSAENYSREASRMRVEAETQVRNQIQAQSEAARQQMQRALDDAISMIAREAEAQASAQRHEGSERLNRYLEQLRTAQANFENWFAQLKHIAGSRSDQIPPPPSFPALPSAEEMLPPMQPIDVSAIEARVKNRSPMPAFELEMSKPAFSAPAVSAIPQLNLQDLQRPIELPGSLSFDEAGVNGEPIGAVKGFDALNLMVPGFGVTFLLIGMLMGISMTLIDERDWGTLARLRSASAPIAATLSGKMISRFIVGLVQMMILFAIGKIAFGISLGSNPIGLIIPSAAIAFAGASFGLIVAGIARTRDAVLPVGAIVVMAMSAIGGCWWPLDFEPAWMKTVALGLPTTWAMQTFNDLMIRGLPVSAALGPSILNVIFGFGYMAIGLALTRRHF